MIWPDDYTVWHFVGYGALCLVALWALARAWLRRPKMRAGLRFAAQDRLRGLAGGLKVRFVNLPLALRTLGVLLLLVALTRPQAAQEETAEVEGIDIMVALDLSGSMLSVDISDEALIRLQNAGKEPEDRFKIAQRVLREFIESRRYDRVGLVIFGKQAFLQFPLTLDYGVMLQMLDRMSLDDIDGGATAIGNALAMSLSRLKESEATTKLVILITDGEDNGSNIAPLEMADEMAKRKIKVFPILVGSAENSRQPSNHVDAFTGHRIYRRVENPVNPALLKEIAQRTEGRYYSADDEESLREDFHDILDHFEKSRLVDYAAAERSELFMYFLLPGLALLLLELLLAQTILRRFP